MADPWRVLFAVDSKRAAVLLVGGPAGDWETGGGASIAEEATLCQLREAREQSQVAAAKQLHIKQAAVSKLERRTDMYLSTLRGYIEAMGGKLEIIARFKDQGVRINQFEALDPNERSQG